jgi:hypothetical protein
MPPDCVSLRSDAAALRFDPDRGMIRDLTFTDAGRRIAPLHRVPWLDEALPAELPPHLRRMEGDFFCAPFSRGGGAAPVPHGWPANGQWRNIAVDGSVLTAVLAQHVQGARVEKRLVLRHGHPFLYQAHRLTGGVGRISAANHAMVTLPSGGRLGFSPRARFRTPARALEPDPGRGRSALAYPAETADPRRFPGAAGGTTDLTVYPWGSAHEDFVVAQEAAGSPLGWTAVVRPAEGDLVLSLRDPGQLPVTMLWHSNGGRDYAPWLGRHRACLGIEEGRAGHLLGQDDGFPLGGEIDIRHAIGALVWQGAPVSAVTADGTSLTVTGEDGHRRTLPFDRSHLFPHRSPP